MNPVDADHYRAMMGRLVSGVSVVTTRYRSHDLAMTATSVVSVSLHPPTVLFTVHEDARLAEAVEAGAGWVVNILGAGGMATADWLASPGRPALGQLAAVAHTRSGTTQAAILDDATAWVECTTQWVKTAATHLVVVGEVIDAGLRAGDSGAIIHAYGRLEQFGGNGEM